MNTLDLRTHFDLAVEYAKTNNEQKWDIAKEISLAVEDGSTVREIAFAVDGSYDKVMTYGNYQSAHIMREIVRRAGSNKLDPLMTLPISYWWTSYHYMMKGVDIEYIIDILFDTMLEDNKLRGQRWLKFKLSEFVGDENDTQAMVKSARKWITRFTNIMYSMSESMDLTSANLANRMIDHLTEMGDLLDELDPV